ncbi:MAG: carbohydrate binding domain-containing protein [Oscillospiraceae bacterium]|nr:carbohydrate binding domain-containing protein [Oscillospiraceae bacterium]
MKNKCKNLLAILCVVFILIQTIPLTVMAEDLAKPSDPTVDQVIDIPSEQEETEVEPEIIGEDTTKREPSIKYFRRSDGSYTAAIYNEPVHYEENGKFVDIDNTLITAESKDGHAVYTNKANNFHVELPSSLEAIAPVTVRHEEYSLSWVLEGQMNTKAIVKQPQDLEARENQLQKSPVDNQINQKELNICKKLTLSNKASSVTYQKALAGEQHLRYDVFSDRLKESIVLDSLPLQKSFVFSMEAKGLTGKLQENKSVEFYSDNANEPIFIIDSPFMFDVNGKYSNNINVTFEQTDDEVCYVIEPDRAWLEDNTRFWPVTIDPTIIKGDFTNTVDSTCVLNSYTSYDDLQMWNIFLQVGKLPYGTEVGAVIRSDILSSLDMYASARIIDAQLILPYNSEYQLNPTGKQINAYKITSSWGTANPLFNVPQYESTVLDYVITDSMSGNANLAIFDITRAAQQWVQSGSNYGILLKGGNISSYGNKHVRFYDSDHTGDIDPKFLVTFRDTRGLENYWTYTSVSAGRAGTAYIQDFSGDLVFVHDEVATTGLKMPITLSRVYNGTNRENRTSNAPQVGKGWNLTLQQSVTAVTSPELIDSYPYYYTDQDGTDHYFYKKSTSELLDEDGLGLKLETTSTGYTITDKNDNVKTFNNQGRLSSIKDANNNKITINFESDNKTIDYIEDGSGHIIFFTLTDNGYVRSITDPAGRLTTYYYDSFGSLTTIIYPDNTQSVYTYDSDHALTSATDPTGYKIEFQYTSVIQGKRIKKAIEKSSNNTTGQTIMFDRSEHNMTQIVTTGANSLFENGDGDDITTTYQFDNAGRTMSTSTCDPSQALGASAVIMTAANVNSDNVNDIKKLNRVTKDTSLGRNTVNLMKNHGAEIDGNWTALEMSGSNTFTFTRSTSQKYIGNRSFQMTCTASTGGSRARAYQDFTDIELTPGKTYTFSAYVKTNNIVRANPSSYGYGAVINLHAFKSDGTYEAPHSEHLTGTTDNSINNGWRRISTTLEIPEYITHVRANVMVRNATGTAYFDAMQVEEANVPHSYNLLENSSFESGATGWIGLDLTTSDGVIAGTNHHGNNSFKITGSSSKIKEVYQDVPVSGVEGDTYIVSGWSKADAVSNPNGDRRFNIGIRITYDNGATAWKTVTPFNNAISGWQYTAIPFNLGDGTSAAPNPTNIRIYLRYQKQANKAYYDRIQLIKDEVNSYSYDSEGNLISTVKNAEQKSTMEYYGNDLTKQVNSKGYDYSYEYDSRHNLTQAKSQRGVLSNYAYNAYGNPTSLIVKNSGGTMQIQTGTSYTAASPEISAGAYLEKVYDQNNVLAAQYNYNLKKGLVNWVKDAKGQQTTYSYNVNNDALTNISRGGKTITYGYNSKNQLSTIAHNGFSYGFTYDNFGNLKQTKVGAQILATNNYQANNGSLESVVYGNGYTVNYGYNVLGLVSSLLYNGVTRYT